MFGSDFENVQIIFVMFEISFESLKINLIFNSTLLDAIFVP